MSCGDDSPLIIRNLGDCISTNKERYVTMDFETFLESLFRFIQNGGNAYFVVYALITCLLTQVVKKLFVSKVKVDVLHKFDFAVVLPFIFGAIFAVVDVFCVKRVTVFDCRLVVDLAVNTATIGALATTVFKLISSLSGGKLSRLLSDDVFAIFYSQLMYFGNAREQLLNKSITLKQFVTEVKLVATNAVDIYKQDCSEEAKLKNLAKLLAGIIDEKSVNTCVNSLHKAMLNYVAKATDTDKQNNA